MRDIQRRPLRPVPRVIHERLHLIVTKNCQMVHIVSDRNIFDRKPPMRTVMHPTGVMRLHLQRVNKHLIKIVARQELGKTFMTELLNHAHDRVSRSQTRGSLDISQNLGIKLVVSDPTNFGTLHRIPEPNTLLVRTPSLSIVRQIIGERPGTDLINRHRRKPSKLAKIVIRHMCLSRDSRTTIGKTILAGVVTTMRHPKGRQIHIPTVTIRHRHRHPIVITSRLTRCRNNRLTRCRNNRLTRLRNNRLTRCRNNRLTRCRLLLDRRRIRTGLCPISAEPEGCGRA